MKNRRGFTLIELITVMAITAILLTIIAFPVLQSFNLTRASQGFANAQSKARNLIAQVEQEISNSAGVRDNTGFRGAVDVPVPGANGAEVIVRLPYSKLDILKVAAGDPRSRVGTAYIDPDTGKVDPTLKSPKGQPNAPATPGDTVIRYFIGLRDPALAYFNPFIPQYKTPASTSWMGAAAGRDNLFVLYRAEVRPYIWWDPDGAGPQPPQRVVNSAFFIDQDRADADPVTTGPLMDDPSFFVWDDSGAPPAIYGAPRPYDPANRNEMVNNWLKASTVVTESSRYDMVMPKYNPSTFAMSFVGNVPELVALVRFNPSRVARETATGRTAVRTGEETENAINIGPDVFETEYKNWSGMNMRIWPSTLPSGSGPLGNSAGGPVIANPTGNFLESLVKPDNDQSLFLVGTELFNQSAYLRLKSQGVAYPMSGSTIFANLVGINRQYFIPMVPNAQTGKVIASFPIQEWGVDAGVPYDERIPSTGADPGIDTGPAVTPATAGYQVGTWNTFSSINERFAVQYNNWASFFPAGAPAVDGPNGPKRYIDLRQIPQFGPSNQVGPLNTSFGLVRGQITPGSVELYGPDQRPGANYGRLVRYEEVPNTDSTVVGTNQFKVNYTHKANEPNWASLFGFAVPNYGAMAYNAADFLSATMQARYRPGYIELNSRYGEPIPVGNIFVSYRFQFTDSKTVLAVDYDSGELMEVVLTIRNYPQTSIPNPQMVTVRGSAAVRNTLR